MSNEDKNPFPLREVTTYHYYCDGQPQGGDARANCSDCGGAGEVFLLTSARPCKRCGGSGRAGAAGEAPAGRVNAPPTVTREELRGKWVTECRFDDQDRLISQCEGFVPDEHAAEPPKA